MLIFVHCPDKRKSLGAFILRSYKFWFLMAEQFLKRKENYKQAGVNSDT